MGEAIALNRGDLLLDEGLLTITGAKFGKARQLRLHPTTVDALGSYPGISGGTLSSPRRAGLLRPTNGQPCQVPDRVRAVRGARHLGRPHTRSERCRPTIHGLRHSFAVDTLIRWYRRGPTSGPGSLTCRPGSAIPIRSGRTGLSVGLPRAAHARRPTTRGLLRGTAMTAIGPTLQAYFSVRLISQRQASPHTIAAYRDCYRLLFAYLGDTTGKQPAKLDFDDLDAEAISGFLTYLEKERGVSVSTRNARLVALRSWFTSRGTATS